MEFVFYCYIADHPFKDTASSAIIINCYITDPYKEMASIALIIIMSICNILMSLQVSQYLRSRNWDTRVAAAHAIGSIAENVRHTSLKELLKSLEGELMEAGYSDVCKDVGASVSDMCPNPTAGLSFKRWCVNIILQCCSLQRI